MHVLYILMRNDMASMNAGKAMAQASHASNAFVKQAVQTDSRNLAIWEQSTSQGFGTVLVLEASGPQIQETIRLARSNGYVADIIHDPTYPVVDGQVVHHIPVDTCGYVFVPDKEQDFYATALLKSFPLHK